MPKLDAAGDAATGAVIARSFEPGAGQRGGHTHELNCLNCGARLTGDYCHACGQKSHVHRTLTAWWHDFLHSVVHLDGKFWRTLPMLAWRPGELTRRYVDGERAKFVSPMAIFLFSVFLKRAEGDGLFEAAVAKARENPDLLLYKMQANAYKFSWALIPLSVPFVWLLFLHRRRYRESFSGYDHLGFVTYSTAFMSLALVVWVLLGVAGVLGNLLGVIVMLIPPVHMYRQLRGAYALSRWSAAWRAMALLIFANVALGLFTMLLLLLGALG